MHRRIFLLILPLLLASFACQANEHDMGPFSISIQTLPSPTATSTIPLPTLLPTLTPVPSPTKTPVPTWTSLPSQEPKDHLPTSATAIPTPLPQKAQLRIFEDLWETVKEEYLYPDFNGLDWDAMHVEYEQRILDGLDNASFYLTMDEMIFRLGDDHSFYLSPEEAAYEEAEYSGDLEFVGIGILYKVVPERKRVVIRLVFPGSPAEQAGLESHDSILTVNGEPVLDEDGYPKELFYGPEGSQVTLQVQTPGEAPRSLTIIRHDISGGIPIPYRIYQTPAGKRIGYMLLVSLADRTIPGKVREALKEMNAGGKLDGLILDNRLNEGGADTVLKGVLSYFTHGVLGYFTSRDEKSPFNVGNIAIFDSQTLPLVVLVGPDTVSFGEVMSGVLQDNGRAYLIGETTYGNVETLWGYDFEDGSLLWLAHETFQPALHPSADWEQTGIVPDETVITEWDLITFDNDPAMQAALLHFDQAHKP